jgi:ATP-dependent helicase/nuclease subunit B
VADWPGFRRRLRKRFATWTRWEVAVDGAPPAGEEATTEEWSVYEHYCRILITLDAADAEGSAVWASKALEQQKASAWKGLGALDVCVLDLEDEAPSVRRALSVFEARARSVRVSLPYDPDPRLAEVFAHSAALRQRMLDRGYEESCHAPDLWRKPGLRDAESLLFQADSLAPILDPNGLTLLGAPQGEGVGLVVAREVRRLLNAERVDPEDVLVLVPSWDENAEVLLNVLTSWGLPVSAAGRPRGVKTEPAVAALCAALRLKSGDWEASEVIHLLRHGRFRPDWSEINRPRVLERAAAAIRDSHVFRGRERLIAALAQTIRESPESSARGRAEEALLVLERLGSALDSVALAGTWSSHVARTRKLAQALGINDGDAALERFLDALDDQAELLDRGERTGPVGFATFVSDAEHLARDEAEDEERIGSGTVVVSTLDRAAGARARYIVLANLEEGSFPSRAAIESKAFGREMSRFLRVIGSAGDGVILASPTRDERGQEILAAGFFDDLKRRIPEEARPLSWRPIVRLDPSLIDHEDLAVAPADARARAVALACQKQDERALVALAAQPRHRDILNGAADALWLTSNRMRRGPYSRFDGQLADPAVATALLPRFGASCTFSASQLESYLSCPFQFFSKYVLKLSPVNDGDELDEDYLQRGDRLHKILEELEQRLRQEPGDRLEVSRIVLSSAMSVELTVASEADPGLHTIENRRLEDALTRYVRQMTEYEHHPKLKHGSPAQFEVAFGASNDDGDLPSLILGEGPFAVRLQGKIDRVDVVETPGGPQFRVIDYKTGACPTGTLVKDLVMVQLPLYALAVERLALVAGAGLSDLGYWALKSGGYKKIELSDWPAERAKLESTIQERVAELRTGHFEVAPHTDGCERTCDYAMACRIGQIRRVEKTGGPERSTT